MGTNKQQSKRRREQSKAEESPAARQERLRSLRALTELQKECKTAEERYRWLWDRRKEAVRNLHPIISVDDLAGAMGVSRAAVYNLLRSDPGTNPTSR